MRDPQAGLGGDGRMNTRAVMASLATLAALAAGIAVAGTGPAGAVAKIPAVRGGIARRTEPAGAVLASPGAGVARVACTAPAAYRPFAARLSAGIEGALRGRAGHQAVTVRDTVTGISCQADAGRQFDSASIVKVIILAALLRWHQETRIPLSPWENGEAALMITRSDNDAASDLWQWVGMSRLQRFLNLAAMGETVLGPGEYWGLTQVTANDEMLLLDLLTQPNLVLSDGSRSYELALMARVIPGQRWGTPAGAPAGVTVHVKNGWLPDATGWHINSIGAFTGKGVNYAIAVLTDDNPSEQYGIDTIQDVARLAHRELSAARAAAGVRLAANVAPSPAAAPSPGTSAPARPAPPTPWAVVPALPARPAPWAVVPALPVPLAP
jgi:beta-lactamase class A